MTIHKYQVGILGDDTSHGAALRSTLLRRIDDLGMAKECLVFLSEAELGNRNRKAAFVAVFFGYKDSDDVAHPVLADLLEDSVVIFPVVPDCDSFSKFVPTSLHPINGLKLDTLDVDLERLAGLILEALRLLRANRRLFISYRRIEAQTVAIQTYETMDAKNFDTFLDTRSVKPGEPFQDILWHRLADTDVLVLLDTPGFQEGSWPMEELARANTTNLQILQVIWPGLHEKAEAALSRFMFLEERDFETTRTLGPSARLVDGALERLALEVESLRARAFAARMAYLVDEFCNRARAHNLTPIIHSRIIEVSIPGKSKIAIIPAIGVPDARLYQEVYEEVSSANSDIDQIWLLYDERGVRDGWLRHLEWLSLHVPVRGLRVLNSDSALRDACK